MSIGNTVFYFEQTGSTNLLAKRFIQRGAPSGSVVVAGNQFSGKGQGNKTWFSHPNENLLATFIVYPEKLNAESLFYFNMAFANSVASAIESLINAEVQIKWPNDIYVFNKKISGLLVESVIHGSVVKQICAGVGLNINQIKFPSEINATSLKLISGKNFEIIDVLVSICKELNKTTNKIVESIVQEEYNNKLWQKNVLREFIIDNKKVEAAIKFVDKNGKLWIETKDGDFSFNHGEIGFSFNEI